MQRIPSKIIILLSFCLTIPSFIFARSVVSLNDGWQFILSEQEIHEIADIDSGWTGISLPHTWNDEDAFDETPGYKRAIGWYKKKIKFDEFAALKENSSELADVFTVLINDEPVIERLDLKNLFGINKAVIKKVRTFSSENTLDIRFKSISGEPVLNGIGIRKVD